MSRARIESSFSSVYARVKAGENARPPYVAPTIEYAVCKRCGAKVSRQMEAIEAHESKCGVRSAQIEDQGGGDALSSTEQDIETSKEDVESATEQQAQDGDTPLPKTFSATSMELAATELCRRLSSESRHLFEEAKETSLAGWQRYSVSFGAGRMGLEFEYDGRGTRRLVVTRASREAARLGVRARDVLIGIGNRTVPRATDPMAVHHHLLTCSRPVEMHFYRLHVRRKEKGRADGGDDKQDHLREGGELVPPISPSQDEVPNRLVSRVATAVWDRLPAVFSRRTPGIDEPSAADQESHEVLPEPAPLPPPEVLADPKRYYDEDEPFETSIASARARGELAAELKPMLRMRPWRLLYDSSVDGMCLEALYAHAKHTKDARAPQLLLVRDDRRNVAGAFVDERIRNAGDYFGTGECFVFNFDKDDSVHVYRWVGPYADAGAEAGDRIEAHYAAHQPSLDSAPDGRDFQPPEPPPLPSIENDMFIYAREDVLGFGSGGGGFAIRLDEALEVGASRPCATYGTPASLFDRRDTFPINRVQLFEFAPQWA